MREVLYYELKKIRDNAILSQITTNPPKVASQRIFLQTASLEHFGSDVSCYVFFLTLEDDMAASRPFLMDSSLYYALLCLIFLVTSWRIEELVPISLTRLAMHTAPLILLWLLFQIKVAELLPKAWMTPENPEDRNS